MKKSNLHDPGTLIIITSDEPWSNVWHTQLHYANQLSQYFQVIYLNPPEGWKLKNILGISLKKQKINSRLLVLPYHNLLPVNLGKLGRWVNDVYNEALLVRYSGKISNRPIKKIIWHFDPFRAYYFFRRNKNVFHVYHVVDPFSSHDLDVKLAQLAQLVIVTSPKFLDHYKAISANAILIKQGVDMKFYREKPAITTEFVKDYKNIIVLLGTLSDQVDFKILHEILVQSHLKLIIIGPDKITNVEIRNNFTSLCTHPRCEWLGAMNPEEYKPYLEVASLGIIAYNDDIPLINNLRSPLKVISYLAAGLPVVTNIDSEIPELMNKAIYFANNHDSFMQLVSAAINKELYFDKVEVNKYLESINYPKLLEKIFKNIGMKLPEPFEN